MPQINDAINAAIPDSALANHVNDKQLRSYLANGATSLDINSAEAQFLVARGEVAKPRNDMWSHYLGVTKAFAGALDDQKMIYWGTGPRP